MISIIFAHSTFRDESTYPALMITVSPMNGIIRAVTVILKISLMILASYSVWICSWYMVDAVKRGQLLLAWWRCHWWLWVGNHSELGLFGCDGGSTSEIGLTLVIIKHDQVWQQCGKFSRARFNNRMTCKVTSQRTKLVCYQDLIFPG